MLKIRLRNTYILLRALMLPSFVSLSFKLVLNWYEKFNKNSQKYHLKLSVIFKCFVSANFEHKKTRNSFPLQALLNSVIRKNYSAAATGAAAGVAVAFAAPAGTFLTSRRRSAIRALLPVRPRR